MHTHGGRGLQIPLARVMLLQRLVCEHPGRANFHQVAAEFALQRAIFVSPKVDVIVRGKDIEVASACIVAIETHAAVTLDATIHLVIDERAKILVRERTFRKTVFTIRMAGHHRHILQMTFAPLVTHGTIVRMVHHQPLNHTGAKVMCFRVIYGNTRAFSCRGHARHHDFAVLVVLVFELLDRALPARTHRTQRRVPTEIRQIEAQ